MYLCRHTLVTLLFIGKQSLDAFPTCSCELIACLVSLFKFVEHIARTINKIGLKSAC